MREHPCANPCSWPACLTEAEKAELAGFLTEDNLVNTQKDT
jgi:hypothetical protein